MKKEDVPQHRGLFGDAKAVCYAVDDKGDYSLSPTVGWDPVNFANLQAWEAIVEEVSGIAQRVRLGELSPLAFHMAYFQMDVPMLAKYVRMARWRVRRHLRPTIFAALKPQMLDRYARVFRISAEELSTVPDELDLPVPVIDTDEDHDS